MKKKQFLFFTCTLFFCSLFAQEKRDIPQVERKTSIDSIGYAFGMLESQFVSNDPEVRMSLGEREMFAAGFLDALAIPEADSLKRAYYLGINRGLSLTPTTFERINEQIFQGEKDRYINQDVFVAGFLQGLMSESQIDKDSINQYLQESITRINKEIKEKQFAANITESTNFLKANKKKKGVKTLPNGLQYKVITKGSGKTPTKDDTVKVHYKGTLIDGTEFDSSYERDEPFVTKLDGVIKGWQEIIPLMPVGSKWEVYIPYELGYADNEVGSIPPFSTLIFEIELLGIEDND